ncbi:MAG: tetratricopeptide repeat protein [Parachlamydiales bacterium]|jgi:tetratricopeptide (TPR) repeat protein
MKKKKIIILFLSFFFLFGCYKVEDKIEPKIICHLKEDHINSLKNPFKPLSSEEKSSDWGKEFIIAKKFSKDFDLYRGITNFKRALILIDDENTERKLEIEYNILFCYYLGKKYDELIDFFDKSSLCFADKSFEAFEDLLVILYESYHELQNDDKQRKILELLHDSYPEIEKKIIISTHLIDADVDTLSKDYSNINYVNNILKIYEKEKKSVRTAQFLNTFIPGAGYLYIGQKRSALTAFMLNSLFIYGSYEFFHKGWTAAGVITASFEAGWYFGGIYGAGEEANFYNERVFERLTTPVMNKEKLFPVFMIKYGF